VETEGPLSEDALTALANDIRTRVVERTGIRPERIELLPPGTLPRTSSGKLRRREAARLWLSSQLVPPKAVTVLGMTIEMARGELHHLRNALRGTSSEPSHQKAEGRDGV
jgi:hypothetical protein